MLVNNSIKNDLIYRKFKLNIQIFASKCPNGRKIVINSEIKYCDLTNITNENVSKIKPVRRELKYSVDYKGNKYYDFFFEKNITNERKYQKILEKYLNKEVALNPKARGVNNKKFFDYWLVKEKIAWDLKTLDGNSKNIIDNVLNKSCKKRQAQRIVMNMGKTSHTTEYLKSKIIEIFNKGKRPYIKEIMFFDKNDSLILHLKR